MVVAYDLLSKCLRCHNERVGSDPCVIKKDCRLCNSLTSDQKLQLATPTYKTCKDNKTTIPQLVHQGSVQILGEVDASLSDQRVVKDKGKAAKESTKRSLLSHPDFLLLMISRHWMRNGGRGSPGLK